ncbi:MAG: ATP-binding protein [Methanomicrobiales archaeon]|nr:ATP-binding protein [Methanomicrobiales archaeon]
MLKIKLPFSHVFMVILLLLITLSVLAGIWIFLDSSERYIRENSVRQRAMTESHINNSFRMIDAGLKLSDNLYNNEMRDAFVVVLEEYNRTGGDPSQMDLIALKGRIGGMNIHLINDRCVIEHTSLPSDLGLDFAVIYPDFCQYLHRIWNTSGFYPDRVVMEWIKGRLTKFAYMPAPDHRYIIELGLASENFTNERMQLQYSDVIEEVRDFNPYIEEIKVFQKQKRLLYNISYVPTPAESRMLDYLLWENRTSQVVQDPEQRKTIVWEVVDLRDPDYAADTSLFTEITYDDALIDQEVDRVRGFSMLFASMVILGGAAVALAISRRVSRPLEQMMEDMDAITRGDLSHPIRDVSGFELSTLRDGIIRMIGQLKENIRRCEASERRFADLVQLLPQGVFETDPIGQVTYANPMAYHLFGMERTETGLNIFDILAPEDRDRAKAKFAGILHGEKTEGSEYTGVRKDGSRFPIMVYTTRIILGDRPIGIRGSIVDISRLKKVEREIRELNAELERRVQQRTLELEHSNEDMEAFIYSISHDLRAPLRAIDGFSFILFTEAKEKLDGRELQYLEAIRQNIARMNDLIDGLLALSRLGRRELNRSWIQPEPLVRDVVAELSKESPKIQREIIIKDMPPFFADPVMLRQVFYNLISNAMKFTRDMERPKIEAGATEKGGQTVYYVSDNGIGFDMQYGEKIFKPFQKLHRGRKYEGYGIGLAIVHRIIKRHGGRIWAEGAPGSGAAFYFTIGSES